MAFLEIKDLHFSYPDQSEETLAGVNLSVKQGEFVVLCGPSGCGKTTLLRHLKTELKPIGTGSGEIRYKGQILSQHDPEKLAWEFGMVEQDPDNQIVMEQVQQELAFGLENKNMPTDVMRLRIAEMAHFFGLEGWLTRHVHHLSGGEKQLVSLAAVLLLQPNVLLLDEPTAQLDPVAAKEFLNMVRRLNEEFGLTVIMTEHRLEELFPMADQVIMMDRSGKIKYAGKPQEVIRHIGNGRDSQYVNYLPSLAKLYLSMESAAGRPKTDLAYGTAPPLTVREGRIWLQTISQKCSLDERVGEEGTVHEVVERGRAELAAVNPILECKELSFQYEKKGQPVLKQLDLEVRERDFLAIVGGNGAGKSTLLQLMAGLLRSDRGSVRFRGKEVRSVKEKELRGKIGYLSQNPMAYFLHDTVAAELEAAVLRSPLKDAAHRMQALISSFELERLLPMHPHDLSGGERQKAALACVLLAGPELLLLDEPTKGLDPLLKRAWGELLQSLHEEGIAIVMVTHDVEFAAQYVKRCAMLFDGAVTSEGTPGRFFGDNYFYTTVINRLVRDRFPEAITYEEVLAKWIGQKSPF